VGGASRRLQRSRLSGNSAVPVSLRNHATRPSIKLMAHGQTLTVEASTP